MFKKLFVISILITVKAMGQMPHDAIYMPKNTYCLAMGYQNSAWSEYWEGLLKRDNANMGTHTTQMYMPMIAAGIGNKLNLIASLPYVSTMTSAGNLKGQKGLQDLNVQLKYRILNRKGISLNLAGGGSIPIGNYIPDFLPMSIGLGSKTLNGRLIGLYQHKSGLYAQSHANYTYRSTIKIDRDAYQANGKIYNTSIVSIPNAVDARLALGYQKKSIQAEVFVDEFKCLDGDNIRRNDMPFPTNNMQARSIGGYAKFQPKNIGFNVRYSKVIDGLNMGLSNSYSVAFLYQINGKKK